MFKTLISAVLLMSTQVAVGAELETTTTIKTLFLGPEYEHMVFIGVEDQPTQSRPSGCGANGDFHFVLDLRGDYAKEYYSALLAAYFSKTTLRIRSEDFCKAHPNIPDLKNFWLQ